MSYYEYRVVPAPKSIPKVKGVKGPEGRYAFSMAEVLNAEGRDGWEFQRSETLETELKAGLFSKRTRTRLTVLVFRRWVETEATEEILQATPVFQSEPLAAVAPSFEPAPFQRRASLEREPVMQPEFEDEDDRPYPASEEVERGQTAPRADERPVFSARRGEADRDMPPLSGPSRD